MRKGFTQVDLDMDTGTEGEKFYANLWPVKRAWDKHLAEMEAQVAREKYLDRLTTKFPTVMDNPYPFWRRPVTVTASDIVAHEELSLCGKILREHVKTNSIMLVEVPFCECGVAITGGLHSDWCPAKETDG